MLAWQALLEAEDACLENEKRQLQNDASAVEQLLRDLSAAEGESKSPNFKFKIVMGMVIFLFLVLYNVVTTVSFVLCSMW